MGFLENLIRKKTNVIQIGSNKAEIVYAFEVDNYMKKLIENSIRKSYSNNMTKNFRHIKFIIESFPQEINSNLYTSLLTEETQNGSRPVIHIHENIILENMRSKTENELVRDIVYSIVQKLTDCWQEYNKRILSSREKTSDRLERSVSDLFTKLDKNITSYRIDSANIIRMFQQDGISTFIAEQVNQKIPFDEDTFWDIHRIAEAETYKIVDDWKKYITTVSVASSEAPKFNTFSTNNIGLHMVYTILFFNSNLEINDVVNMKPFEFIRYYEKSVSSGKINNKGTELLISLNSGKGVLDYNRMLNEWNKVITQIKSRSVM